MDILGPAPWAELAARVRDRGPQPLTRLADTIGAKRATPATRERLASLAYDAPTVVGLPDGDVSHLLHVFDRCWFTQRVRSSTRGRDDLWATAALAPIVTTLIEAPLPLACAQGLVKMSEHLHPAMVGPPGWLPEVPRRGLIGVAMIDGAIAAQALDEPEIPLELQQDVRELVGRHYRNEKWYGDDDPTTRATLTRALACAVLEVPELLRVPTLPLDELLYDPLAEQHRFHFRDLAALRQCESVGVSIHGVPVMLWRELEGRATRYGMSLDQFVIALLGHLAWRTPFAEDLEPWEAWLPDEAGRERVQPLRPTTEGGTL